MKLELKHLAPYLPYNLKMKEEGSDKIGILVPWLDFRIDFQIELDYAIKNQAKPILIPLSDFNYRDNWGYPNKEMFYEDVKNKTMTVKLWKNF